MEEMRPGCGFTLQEWKDEIFEYPYEPEEEETEEEEEEILDT